MIKRIIEYFRKKISNPIQYSKKIGVKIGDNCRFIGLPKWGSEPWLITIGNHVEISYECAFITHDGATWVIRDWSNYKDVIKFGRIDIGNNVFIGARSTILPGVVIGDNTIIGACSLVNKNIPANEVWAGVPARFIMTTEEYAKKCLFDNLKYDKNNFINNKRDELERILKRNNS